MRHIMLDMLVKKGMEERFIDTWKSFAPRIAKQSGNAGQVMLRDFENPKRFLIASDWRDERSLKSFRESTLRRELSAALDVLRDSAQNRQFEVVARFEATEGGFT